MQLNFNRDKSSGKGKDQGGGDLFEQATSIRGDVKTIIDKWNSYIWLPKVVGTDRQARLIREALQRPFFKNNWEESFSMMARSSKFLLVKMKPGVRLDWWLVPDNFDKIMEGQYLNDGNNNMAPWQESRPKAATNEEGDEIIQ
jgi:hypothetical protein